MTIDDLKLMYANGYIFQRETGMKHQNYHNWVKAGFIPIMSQMRLEIITSGALKANLDDVPRSYVLKEKA